MSSPPHFLFAVWLVGGIQTVFQNLRTELDGHDRARLSWLPVEMYPDDWITRIPPVSLLGTWQNSMATWNRMRPLRRAGGPFDAAYILEPTLVTFLWRFRRSIPFLLSTDMTPLFCARRKFWYAVPEFDPGTRLSRLKQAVTASVYRSAFHLLPWSTAVRDSLIEDYGIPEDRITVVPPGIDHRRWSPPERRTIPEAARSRPFSVLHVGSDFHRKGADLLLGLAREPEFRDVTFHFVTSDFQADPPPNVRVHRGLSANSDALVQLYRSADAFVLPTRADTYSMVALEAMASGLPVIISRVGGIGDIVVDGSTGYLIPPGDADPLRDRLRMLRTQPALALSMGERGRRRVEDHFTINQQAHTILTLLESAARSRAERHS